MAAQPPVQSTNYIPTLNGLAFIQAWYPGDARAIAWLNENIAGSPIVLEEGYLMCWVGQIMLGNNVTLIN